MKLNCTMCSDTLQWDRFVNASPQGNIFYQTPFLDALCVEYELCLVEKHGKPTLGAIILKDEAGLPQFNCFALSHGVFFSLDYTQQAAHKRCHEGLQIVDFLLSELSQRYHQLYFCLPPHFEDLRSFSWFHYHQPEQGQFQINLNYTGIIDLEPFQDFDTYLATVRQSRRYDFRKAIKEGLTVETSDDIGLLKNLYLQTFERQGIEQDPGVVRRMLSITTNALSQEFGELLICRIPNGEAISATVFLYDDRYGYYLIGANNPVYRHTGSGSFLFLESIRRCMDRKLRGVDVCGINSPKRGDFKTSFNAKPTPYFDMKWERPTVAQ